MLIRNFLSELVNPSFENCEHLGFDMADQGSRRSAPIPRHPSWKKTFLPTKESTRGSSDPKTIEIFSLGQKVQ
jgi:hypothetical protein